MTVKTYWGWVGVVLGVVACGAEPGADEGSPNIDELANELSNNEQCDTAPANAVIEGTGTVNSNQTYGTNQCVGGFLVDVNDYVNVSGFGGGPGADTSMAATWADSRKPTNKGDCERSKVSIYGWFESGSTMTYVGAKASFGVWNASASSCSFPPADLASFPGAEIPSGNYRLGASARHIFPSGSYSIRRVRVSARN